MRAEPYALLAADSTGDALRLLATRRIDVLVSDERMPCMSGADFLAKVRGEYPDVVSIMLTGHADLSTAMRAINAGEVYRFFTKPCDAVCLAAAIRQALQMKELLRQSRRLLHTVRNQAAELAPQCRDGGVGSEGERVDGEVVVFDADPAPLDMGALLREIEDELERAHQRPDRGTDRPRGARASS
jgi:response regulator RpfG family c-di-GMP phosphodiesterase